MKLNLKNPIVFFDLETTGTNINTDRIVEICYLKVYPNGNEGGENAAYQSRNAHTGSVFRRAWHL